MAKEEILGGIRNALERGESIERAKATFINAGYDKSEVEDAARIVSISSQVRRVLKEKEEENKAPAKKTEKAEMPLPPTMPQIKPLPTTPVLLAPKKQKKKMGFIRKVLIFIAVIIFLIILNIARAMLGINF